MEAATSAPPDAVRTWPSWLATVTRVGLGVVWLFAGWAKLHDPDAAVRAVRAYQILPEGLVKPFAWGLPLVELALGVLLVLGLATRAAAWCSVVILLVFMGGIASAWARGLRIECGCFGGGGNLASVNAWNYATELARDTGFLLLALFTALGPRSRWSLDDRLGW